MEKDRLHYFRSLLLREKEELEHQSHINNRFGLERSQTDSVGELSSYDNHPGDAGSETFERSKDLALVDNAVTYLSDIDLALQKIDEGNYGLCQQCGKPISEERLEVIPTAQYCIEHQREFDGKMVNSRPIEEEFLNPGWGRTDFDDTDDMPGFDGEDSWQEVEKYGSSDTPDTYGNGKDDYNDLYIESDEPVGYVEAIEGFLVTDIHGGGPQDYDIARNQAYEHYIQRGEGEEGNYIGE